MKNLLLAFTALAGSTVLVAQERPPLRQLGAIEATSSEAFGPAINLRHTGDGVLVNDPRNRRVLLLDAQLNVKKVVADSTPATATAYSGRTGGLIAYHGDSTLFVDPGSMSMLLIDPKGDVARVMSVPRSQDAMMLGTPIAGTPGLDGRGGLVYRGFPRFEMRRAMPAGGGGSPQAFTPPQMPDSTPVVRVDLTTRKVDTLSWVKIPQLRMEMTQDSAGRMNITPVMNPLPVIDDWAVLSDGSVAMIRGSDYHVDWIRPDGSRESTGKIPFDWRRLSDDDKVAFMDSVKAQRERMIAEAPRDTAAERMTMRGGPPRRQGAPAGGADGRRAMVEGGARIMIGGGGGDPTQMMGNSQLTFVEPQELPDYQPVFFANSVRADADGNVWVRTIPTKAVGPGATYDVINGRGELVDRVQVPANRTIIGFGSGGVVYLAATADGKTTLERARVR